MHPDKTKISKDFIAVLKWLPFVIGLFNWTDNMDKFLGLYINLRAI